MQLIRTILIIIIVYYLVKLFARYVLPLIARYFIKKSIKNFENQNQANSPKNGEVNIKYKPDKTKSLDNLGEYIDYEEIEDDQK